MKLLDMPISLLEALANGLKTLAHPDRLRIVEILEVHGDVTVGEIKEHLDRPQSVVSQHLGLMKRAGLLESTRSGKNVHYRIADDRSLTILNCVRKKAGAMAKGARS